MLLIEEVLARSKITEHVSNEIGVNGRLKELSLVDPN